MYTLCHSYIFRNCFNFCHSTNLSHRKRGLKHPINMTSNSGFVRPEKFHPYADEDIAVSMDGQLLIDCRPVWTCLKTISQSVCKSGSSKERNVGATNNKQTAKMDPLLPPGSLACLLCKGAVSLRFVGFIWF